jgi:flagellar biogenesis protein FliO
MFVALGSVLGIFWAVTQLLKRIQPKPSIRLPNEALEVLGSTPIGTNQQLLLLRFGNKVILVSQQPGGTSCLSEVTEPESVSKLLAACGKSDSLKEAKEPVRVEKLIEGLFRSSAQSRHTA